MNSQTVVELKTIAKQLGLKGYSCLRKAELIDLIRHTSHTSPPRGVVEFETPPITQPVPAPRTKRQPPVTQPVPAPRTKKKQPAVVTEFVSANKQPPVASYQLKKKQTRREKRENKNNQGYWKVPLQAHNPPEKQVKERQMKRLRKKIQKVNRKARRDTRDKKELLSRKKSLEVELEKLKPSTQQLFKLVESESALKKFTVQYTIEGINGLGPIKFLSAVKSVVINFLKEHRNIKIKLVLECNMKKTNIATGEMMDTLAAFQSNVEINLQGHDVDELYEKMMGKVLDSLAMFQKRGSNWIFDSIEELKINTVKYEPLRGTYIHTLLGFPKRKAFQNLLQYDLNDYKIQPARNKIIIYL